MTDRILDITDAAARLRIRYAQIIIEREGQPDVSVPLDELGALILAHPQASVTHAVLSGIMEHGGAVICCDGRNHPAGLMLPVESHSTQVRRFALQAAAKKPLHKRLWQQVVRSKVRAQAATLKRIRNENYGLDALAGSVRSGDPDNVEAQSAQRYWPLLFDDPMFRRRRDAEDQNRLLNYGYAVLRATVGRAVCAAGLHPSLGIHHHNQYNAYCLADDLMEPYRPLVDEQVVGIVRRRGRDAPVDRESKQALLGFLEVRFIHQGHSRTAADLIALTAASLAALYEGQAKRLTYPDWSRVHDEPRP